MKQPLPVKPLFDVIVMHVATGSIKILATDKSRKNAEALAERGALDSKFDAVTYAVVPASTVEAKGRFPWRCVWAPRNRPARMLVKPLEADAHGKTKHEAR